MTSFSPPALVPFAKPEGTQPHDLSRWVDVFGGQLYLQLQAISQALRTVTFDGGIITTGVTIVAPGLGLIVSDTAVITTLELINPLAVQYGGTGLNAFGAPNGSLLIGDGVDFNLGTITGTTDNLVMTPGAGSITLQAQGAQLPGTTTSDSASAGNVGEIKESQVAVGSAVALTTGTAADVTSLSLTAGDWDVWGNVGFSAAAGTTISRLVGWVIPFFPATAPTSPGNGGYSDFNLTFTAATDNVIAVAGRRVSLGAPATVYLGARADFAVSTMGAYGYIGARRVR